MSVVIDMFNRLDSTIMSGNYDFDQHGAGFLDDGFFGVRNAATFIADTLSGGGQSFNIIYDNKPSVWKP